MTRHNGFTLIEVIVATGIASILGTAVVYTVLRGNDSFSQINFGLNRTSNVVEAYNRVYRNVRVAAEFPNQIVVNNVLYTAGAHVLILKLRPLSSSDGTTYCEDTITSDHDVIIYYSDASNNLHELVAPGAKSVRTKGDQIVFPSFDSLAFSQNTSSGNREITMDLQKNRSGSPTPKQIHEVMVARNEIPFN